MLPVVDAQIIDPISYHKNMEIFIDSFLNAGNKMKVCMLNRLREISNGPC